jgi:hypothetical protein
MNALFREVPVGEWFLFRGAIYQKTALSMAVDEKKNWGHVFMREIEVHVLLGTPLHHGPYKPERPWTDYLTPSPSNGRKKAALPQTRPPLR